MIRFFLCRTLCTTFLPRCILLRAAGSHEKLSAKVMVHAALEMPDPTRKSGAPYIYAPTIPRRICCTEYGHTCCVLGTQALSVL
eukprot:scaffold88828_cov19-Tisochrysis_lutea.AAC.2